MLKSSTVYLPSDIVVVQKLVIQFRCSWYKNKNSNTKKRCSLRSRLNLQDHWLNMDIYLYNALLDWQKLFQSKKNFWTYILKNKLMNYMHKTWNHSRLFQGPKGLKMTLTLHICISKISLMSLLYPNETSKDLQNFRNRNLTSGNELI